MITIHCEPAIKWQGAFAHRMKTGLDALGISSTISGSRTRESDVAILLGTTLWRGIEASGDYLLVDRCSFGNTNDWVSLVWNGHGRRGNHMVPGKRKDRETPTAHPWTTGSRRTLCGQHEPYSPHYQTMDEWYVTVDATHFRPHPVGNGNPRGYPVVIGWHDTGLAIALNSSVSVDTVLRGIPTVTMDEGAMAWDVTGHTPSEVITPDRRPWLNWLSWTQWRHDEIRDGIPIRHLFEEI